MNIRKLVRRAAVCAVVALFAGSVSVWAQKSTVPSRIVETVDDTHTVTLHGNVHPLAKPQYDQGALPDSQPMSRMLLLLQRSATQEQTLKQLMDAQQTKSSGSYHAWLTPEQFGNQFGPSDSDIQTVTDWLTSHGFQVAKVAAGRTSIEFSGNVGQVRNAFHTDIHRFVVNGEEHFANTTDPAIPEALAPVVAGPTALNNFPKHPQLKVVGNFTRDTTTGQIKPLFTYTDQTGTYYAVGPADFAKIYNFNSSYTGAGQSIAIVGQSNINTDDVVSFRSMFGLPAYNTPCTNPTIPIPTTCQLSIIVNGPDPGLVSGDEGESDLDVEWSGALAPAAQIIFVTTQSTYTDPTQVSSGVDLSALYIVDNNLAPILSDSYGLCEPDLLTAGNQFYNYMWEQAAAEGITVADAAGDTGPAACDPYPDDPDPNAANQGLAVNGIASTPFNVAVGGTDFNQAGNPTNYWSTTNAANTQESALGYISEIPWDDSACAANYPAACTSVNQEGADLIAGAGGPSSCILGTENTSTGVITCSTGSPSANGGYPKPAFQTNLTPADEVRDIPDISLFAGNGYNFSFYIVCESDTNPGGASCNLNTSPSSTPATEDFAGVGGTSGGTPAFAAIMAMVNQKYGGRQGNANYVLYALASNEGYNIQTACASNKFTNPGSPAPSTCVFYDITTGNNAVACDAGTPNCSNTGTTGWGVMTDGSEPGTNGNPAFTAQPGYDLATGLGSINVTNLLASWGSVSRTATTTTLTGASASSLTSGSHFQVTINVSAGATGPVSLTELDSNQNILGSISCCLSPGLPYTLTNGTVTATTNLLVPGTAYIEGYYGGDTTHAASTSAPLALTVSGANQPSETTLSFVTFYATTGAPIFNTGSPSVPYGSNYILQILVTNTAGTACTSNGALTTPGSICPTGTVALTDNGSALNDWPIVGKLNATNIAKLNGQGIAEDQPIQLTGGSHSLSAAFTPGDTNFGSSTSKALAVTITTAATQLDLFASALSITPGASVTFTAFIVTNSNGNGPTGTMTFTNGSTTLGTANCVPTSGVQDTSPPESDIAVGTAYCTATLTTSVSSLYPPPTGKPGTPVIPRIPAIVALVSLLLFALGLRWIPQTRRRAYAYAGLLAIALLVGVVAGCGGGSSSTGPGSRNIKAAYPGDTNYQSATGNITITVQ